MDSEQFSSEIKHISEPLKRIAEKWKEVDATETALAGKIEEGKP